MRHLLATVLVVPALALAACGGDKQVDTAKYSCADFSKSLATKGDTTSGNYLNGLRKQAALGQDKKVEVRELSLGVFFACRGKPGSTTPGKQAIAIAKQIKDGKFHLPKPPTETKKRSGK